MRTAIWLALVALVAGSCLWVPGGGTAATVLPRHADANCDNAINPADTAAILQETAAVSPGAICGDRADVDCDGDIDGEDGLRILAWFIGAPMPHLITCPEVGDNLP